jgi:CzcA family heavy metal efflux pump
MMRPIVSSSLKYRLLVVTIAAVTMVFGFRQLRNAPVEVLPEFTQPAVEIQTEALGLSAEEVEQLITLGLEQDLLNGVPWLESIRSESVSGLSSIVLTFKPGTDLMRGRQMVSERLTQAFALPHVSRPPTMLQPMSSTSRVMMIGLSSQTLSLIQMSVLARWTIGPRLLSVPGVANVAIWGQRDWQLQVLVDPRRLRERHVSLLQVLETTGNALWVSSLSFVEASTPGTGGFIDNANQRLGIRHILPIVSAAGLGEVPIGATGVRLKDVANVVEGHQPLIGDAVTNDKSNLMVVVDRFPGANMREVSRGLEEALAELRPGLTGVDLDSKIFRPTDFVDAAIHNLGIAMLVGFALLVLVLAVFFNDWRATVIGAVAIALSFMVAALVQSMRGTSLNVMMATGLLMAIGVVVDDAIVHVDAIAGRLRRDRQSGRNPSAVGSILEAIGGMRSSVLFATVIVLLAVSPIFFVGELPSAFLRPIVLSYGLALLASMAVALTVTPALGLLLLAHAPLEHRESRLVSWVERVYARTLSGFVARPGMALGTLVLIVALGFLLMPFVARSVLPRFKERDLLIHLRSAPGTSQPEMSRISGRMSRELRSVPGVTNVGAHVGRAIFGDQVVSVSSAELWVSIDPAADYDQTVARIEAVAGGYPGLRHAVSTYLQERTREATARAQDSIVIRVYGGNDTVLYQASEAVRNGLTGVEGLAGARIARPTGQPTLEVEVDLNAALRHGIKPGDVRRAATTMFSGLQVGNVFEEQKVFDVVVWSVPETRQSLNSLRDLMIDTPGGGQVRLGDVAHVRVVSSPTVIRHEAVKRYMDVMAGVQGRDRGAVAADVRARLLQVPLPLEYHAEVVGEYADRQASRARLLVVAIAALVGIFFLLQAALGSWRLAGLAFASLAAALVGGIAAVFITGGVLSLGSLAGLLAVFGLAARNGIMLLRHYQGLERHGGELFGSSLVLRGSSERVVAMVTATVAVGLALLPALFLGDVPGLEIMRPMAVAVLGGVLTSTFVNLFIVPALYLRLGVSGVRELELDMPGGLMQAPA